MDKILARGLIFSGFHGVTVEERAKRQPFEVNLVLFRDLKKPGQTDDLADTVDYSRVYAAVRNIVEDESCSLVEALAAKIAQHLLTMDKVCRVEVEVRKLEPPIKGEYDFFGVKIERERGSFKAYIGLGSNLGEREDNLKRAVKMINAIPNTAIVEKSSVYPTMPWGKANQPAFMNQAVGIETRLTPMELLRELQWIENSMGRKRSEKWGPRTIDLDILLFGDKTVETDDLTVPHPYLTKRSFVMVSLLEMDPEVRLPDGRLLSGILANMS